jgi:hypothetical protein
MTWSIEFVESGKLPAKKSLRRGAPSANVPEAAIEELCAMVDLLPDSGPFVYVQADSTGKREVRNILFGLAVRWL